MKRLELIELLTNTDELDRLARNCLQTQRGSTTSVAVKLRKNGAGDVQRLIEVRRNVHGFLASGGVEHEENFLWLDEVAQANEFLHERFVDLQAARRVEDQRRAIVRCGELERFFRDLEH